MYRKKVFLAVFFYVLAFAFLKAQSNPPYIGSVDRYIDDVMERYGIPGVALAILKDGEIQYQKCYQHANIEFEIPVSSDILFQLSSLTKIFTATAVFQLVENQRIGLEDDISKYLDDLPENWRTVKIKHLLSHTSGLPEIAVYDKLSQDSARLSVYHDDIRFPAGDWRRYTNTNFWLLERIIEKVTNQKFVDFVLEGQFSSSKNAAIFSGNYFDIVHKRATSYEPNEKGVFQLRKYQFPEFLYGAAGLNLSLEEFINWNRKLDSGDLVSEASKSQMWSQYILNNKEPIEYCYGWHMRKPNNRVSVGFSGGYTTGFRKFIEDDLTIILLTNGYKTRFKIEEMIECLAGLIDKDLENNESQIYEGLLTTLLKGKRETAFQNYHKFKNDHPQIDFERTLNALGYQLINLKKSEIALEVFKLNVSENPESSNVYDSLGEVYEMLGKNAESIKNYKKSLELNPENEHARERISFIENSYQSLKTER